MSKPRSHQATFPPSAPGTNSYFCFFQILVTADIPCLWLNLSNLCLCGHIAFFSSSVFSNLPRSLSYKNTCDSIQCPPGYSNKPPLLKICNLIFSAKLFYALQGRIYKFQGLRSGCLLRDHCLALWAPCMYARMCESYKYPKRDMDCMHGSKTLLVFRFLFFRLFNIVENIFK